MAQELELAFEYASALANNAVTESEIAQRESTLREIEAMAEGRGIDVKELEQDALEINASRRTLAEAYLGFRKDWDSLPLEEKENFVKTMRAHNFCLSICVCWSFCVR